MSKVPYALMMFFAVLSGGFGVLSWLFMAPTPIIATAICVILAVTFAGVDGYLREKNER